jgi:hypothetical protein
MESRALKAKNKQRQQGLSKIIRGLVTLWQTWQPYRKLLNELRGSKPHEPSKDSWIGFRMTPFLRIALFVPIYIWVFFPWRWLWAMPMLVTTVVYTTFCCWEKRGSRTRCLLAGFASELKREGGRTWSARNALGFIPINRAKLIIAETLWALSPSTELS